MKIFFCNYYKGFVFGFLFCVMVILFYTWRVDTNVDFTLLFIFSLAGGFSQLPFRGISLIIVNPAFDEIVFVKNRFLVFKRIYSFKISELQYTYQKEYSGLPTKDFVLSIYSEKSRVIRISVISPTFSEKKLNELVSEIENYKMNLRHN